MIKNVIFDIGNVLLDLKLDETKRLFKELFNSEDFSFSTLIKENACFHNYERGHISCEEFHKQASAVIPGGIEFDKLRDIWNSMVGPFRDEMMEFARELADKGLRTFVLSNTNIMHVEFFEQNFRSRYQSEFSEHFGRVYYSQDMGERKPDPEIYEIVIKENSLIPEETVFFDDLPENIESAKSLGIKGLVIKPGMGSKDMREFISIN